MQKSTLKAEKRTTLGRKVKRLRTDGLIPASIYGKNFKSESVAVSAKDFQKVYTAAGETGLVDLQLGSTVLPILIHHVQYHPLSHSILHADFFKVNLKEKVTAKVPLVFTGEAPAVLSKTGVLLTILTEAEVEALPGDLPDKIEVLLEKLAEVGDTIKIRDLKISDKVQILTNPDSELIKVAPLVSKEAEQMAKEEEAAAATAQAAAAATEAQEAGAAKEEAPEGASVKEKEEVKEEASKPQS